MGIDGRVCQQKNCHHCCNETEMLLTKKDIRRIMRKTQIPPKEFVFINKDGYRMLRNRQSNNKSQCFFLNQNGLCSIYEIRPEGCQFYPFVWNLAEHKVMIDDYCPHRTEFQRFSIVLKRLENLIIKLFGKL